MTHIRHIRSLFSSAVFSVDPQGQSFDKCPEISCFFVFWKPSNRININTSCLLQLWQTTVPQLRIEVKVAQSRSEKLVFTSKEKIRLQWWSTKSILKITHYELYEINHVFHQFHFNCVRLACISNHFIITSFNIDFFQINVLYYFLYYLYLFKSIELLRFLTSFYLATMKICFMKLRDAVRLIALFGMVSQHDMLID